MKKQNCICLVTVDQGGQKTAMGKQLRFFFTMFSTNVGVMIYLRQSVGDIKWSYWSPPCLVVEWPCDGCPLDRVVDPTGLVVDYVSQL